MILVTGKCNKKAHQDSIDNKRVKIFSREEISFFLHTAKTQGMNNDFEIFSLLMNAGMRFTRKRIAKKQKMATTLELRKRYTILLIKWKNTNYSRLKQKKV